MAKNIGRPKEFANGKGAPQLTVRLKPAIHQHILNRWEGPRAYLERLVSEDMLAEEPWYEERFRAFEQIAIDKLGSLIAPQLVVSAALQSPTEEPPDQKELLRLCRRLSVNRTGWPWLYCDKGVSMQTWGLEAWLDHSMGSIRIDGWNLDARGAFHHVDARSVWTFKDLLQRPALALETVHALFSALGGPQAVLVVRMALRNALGLRLVHHEQIHQEAGPLGESELIWERQLSLKDLRSDLVDLAADIYERFRVQFGPSTTNRQQHRENLTNLFATNY